MRFNVKRKRKKINDERKEKKRKKEKKKKDRKITVLNSNTAIGLNKVDMILVNQFYLF